MPGPVLVGYDGSAASKLALEHALALCEAQRRKLVLCSVVPASLRQAAFTEMLLPHLDLSKVMPPGKFPETARRRLEEVAAEGRKRGLEVGAVVREGDAADELISAARELGAEQVVVGHMSYEHKLPYGVGSVAEKVLRYAGCTVTVVRPAGASGAAERARAKP